MKGRTRTAAQLAVVLAALSTVACAGAGAVNAVPPSPFPRAPQPPSTRDLPEAPPTAALPGTTAAPVLPGGSALAASATSSTLTAGHALVQTALSLLGVDYRYGGSDPTTGLDCSGLVWWVFGQHRIDMPRTVDLQYDAGSRIDGANLEAGDLIFFTTTAPGATHVGIALGPDSPGEFVHAPSTNGVVRIERYDSSYWRSRIVGYRRVLPVSRGPVTGPFD